ncbi:MAG: DNA repair protein RecN [Ruthenibacterium sp.]
MLREIMIENVAVIEKAGVQFGAGLNVLSGETGAGKSILIDSINAILGNRTSRELVRSHTPKARIRAVFTGLDAGVLKKLEAAGYEASEELLLYREISADGKSVCRINGLPATAAVVREICAGLIAIHGQHDNQSLMDPSTHLGVLDAFAQSQQAHARYYAVYKDLCQVKRRIDALNIDEDAKDRRAAELRDTMEELELAQLSPGEEEELLRRQKLMQNAARLSEGLSAAYMALNGEDELPGAAGLLGERECLWPRWHPWRRDRRFGGRIRELYYNCRDAASEIADMLSQMEFDAGEQAQLEQRLDVLYRLRQKYGRDEAGLLALLEEAKQELAGIEHAGEELEKLYDRQAALYEKAKALADELTALRLSAYARFEKQLTQALGFLNMPGIRFALKHHTGALGPTGQDTVEFYISTNPGEEPKPLAKIASGGELSRIMLAVKSALAEKDALGTVIYDEIDTGVSGLAAGRIGEMLHKTAGGRQVICITHTAQIAAQADTHLLIEKTVHDGRTYTQIRALDIPGRQQELARMISGDKVTPIALENAREMLRMRNA